MAASLTGFAILLLVGPPLVLGDSSGSGGGYYPNVGPATAPHPVYSGPAQTPDAGPSSYGLPEVAEEHFSQYPDHESAHYPLVESREPGLPSLFRRQPPVIPYNDPSLLSLPPPCAKLAVVYKHLYSIIEPLFVLVIGIGFFILVKNLVLPHLGHWYRSLDLDDEERSLAKDQITKTVLKAIHKGVCVERLACQLGMKTKDYTITDAVVRAIEDSDVDSMTLAAIFKQAASGKIDSCEPYTCSGKTSEINRKKKQIASNEINQ